MSDTHVPPPVDLPPLPPGAGNKSGPAWEQPGPWLGRFVDTVKGVLMEPTRTFAGMRREGGLAVPLSFAVIGLIVGSLASLAFQAIGAGASLAPFLRDSAPGVGSVLATVIVIPVVATITLFVFAGLFHVMLLLLNGARHPFETTFRTYAYASGATALFGLLPVCGGLIGAVWSVVATIIGLTQTQETSTGTAAVAVLVPVAVCCGAALLVFGTSLLVLGALSALAGG